MRARTEKKGTGDDPRYDFESSNKQAKPEGDGEGWLGDLELQKLWGDVPVLL